MDAYYRRWEQLASEAWGRPLTPQGEQDVQHAIDYGIASLEAYINSGDHFDDGAGFITLYDTAELEQAEWFLGVAWDSLAEAKGLESDAWNEQGRGPSRSG